MTDDAPVRRRAGFGWKLALRIAVTVAFLAILLSRAHGAEDVIPEGHHLRTVMLLVAAVIVTLIGVVLSAWRWQRVLCLFDARIPIRTLASYYLVSLFIGTVLPTTIGGDVLRVSRAAHDVGTPTAFGSVVLERLTGFIALPLIVAIGFSIDPSIIDREHAWLAVLAAAITLGVLALILFVAGHPRIAGRFADRENWTRFIGAVHVGVDRLLRRPKDAIPVLATAVVYQFSVIAVFAIVFAALDLDVPAAAILAFVPAVLMVQVLPISISGLGVREGALALFLHTYGVTANQALAAGLLWFGAVVVVSMLGAPGFLIGRRERVHTRDAR